MSESCSAVSMTGFGLSEGTVDDVCLIVRMRSVNQRFLELSIRVPPTLSSWEPKIRKLLQAKLRRGRVEVTVSRSKVSAESSTTSNVHLDSALLQRYVELYSQAMFEITGVHTGLTVSEGRDILQRQGVIVSDPVQVASSEAEEELLDSLVVEALTSLVESRQSEGLACQSILVEYFSQLTNVVNELETRASSLVEEQGEKLRTRISELVAPAALNDSRFSEELAYICDRFDIAEEIQRLKAHLDGAMSLLHSGVRGKKLDFWCQEMGREVNTIASKSQNAPLQALSVEAKSLIERVREQAQNIE